MKKNHFNNFEFVDFLNVSFRVNVLIYVQPTQNDLNL